MCDNGEVLLKRCNSWTDFLVFVAIFTLCGIEWDWRGMKWCRAQPETHYNHPFKPSRELHCLIGLYVETSIGELQWLIRQVAAEHLQVFLFFINEILWMIGVDCVRRCFQVADMKHGKLTEHSLRPLLNSQYSEFLDIDGRERVATSRNLPECKQSLDGNENCSWMFDEILINYLQINLRVDLPSMASIMNRKHEAAIWTIVRTVAIVSQYRVASITSAAISLIKPKHWRTYRIGKIFWLIESSKLFKAPFSSFKWKFMILTNLIINIQRTDIVMMKTKNMPANPLVA